MLDDKVRMAAYRKAIFNTVKSGDLVADIGTGSGVLAFFAVQAGARKVYAIESGPIIDVAKKTAAENDYTDRICFIQGISNEVDIPERVDVIITETIGCFGIDEGIMDIIHDARSRFLKTGGKIIPERLALLAVPVSFKEKHPFNFLEGPFHGIQTGHLNRLAANNTYRIQSADVEVLQLLSEPGPFIGINLYTCGCLNYPLEMNVGFRIEKTGVFDGIVVFPEISLADSIEISLFKDGRSIPSHWELTFFPNAERISLKYDDTVNSKVIMTAQNGFIWENHIRQNTQTNVFRHLSLFGAPSLDHLKK